MKREKLRKILSEIEKLEGWKSRTFTKKDEDDILITLKEEAEQDIDEQELSEIEKITIKAIKTREPEIQKED